MPVELLPKAQARADPPKLRTEVRPGRRREPYRFRRDRILRSPAFLLPLAAYLLAGALLAFYYESFHGDAQNRVANAFYVLFSRDPHLAAIGFVWNPLPSLAVLPLLPLKFIWPALTERAFAGNIVSALFMAGAVYQVHGAFVDLRVRRAVRVVLTVLFAAHPIVLYYGANGMSEASLLFGLLAATRYLSRWLHQRRQNDLVIAGAALAIAYLSRPEALFATFGATLVVLVVVARRSSFPAGVAHATVFAVPSVGSLVVLAGISWVVTGSPFEQFSSVYGTASQVQVIEELGNSARSADPWSFAVGQVLGLTPLLPVAMVLAIIAAVWRRDIRVLAPLSVVGGVLAFALISFLLGQTIASTRYFISAAPLAVLLAGQLAAGRPQRVVGAREEGRNTGLGFGFSAVALAVAAAGLPAGAITLNDPTIDPEDQSHLAYIFDPNGPLNAAASDDQVRFEETRAIAAHVDGLDLPTGSVLVDNFGGCIPFVLLASERPRQFIITNDRDFEQLLADPVGFEVRYLLVPPPGGYGDLNALNRSYPSLYETGAGIATLTHEFEGSGCSNFRLYQVRQG